MLSFAGEIPVGRAGVGDGAGFWATATGSCGATLFSGALEAPAIAKVFNNKPAMHARAHILTAANFRGILSIVPSSGIRRTSATRYARMPWNEHLKRAPHFAAGYGWVVKRTNNFSGR